MEKVRHLGRDAKTWYIKWSPWIAAYLIICALIFFAGAYFIGLGNVLISPITIGWITAFATFAAAVAALYLAIRSERRVQENERFIGQLEAAQYSAYVDSIRVSAVSLRSSIPNPAPPPPDGTPFNAETHPPMPGIETPLRAIKSRIKELPVASLASYDIRIATRIIHMLNQLDVAQATLGDPGGMYIAWHAFRTVELQCWEIADLMQHAKKRLDEKADRHSEGCPLFEVFRR